METVSITRIKNGHMYKRVLLGLTTFQPIQSAFLSAQHLYTTIIAGKNVFMSILPTIRSIHTVHVISLKRNQYLCLIDDLNKSMTLLLYITRINGMLYKQITTFSHYKDNRYHTPFLDSQIKGKSTH